MFETRYNPLALAFAAAAIWPAAASPAQTAVAAASSGDVTHYTVTVGRHEIAIKARDGEIVSATLDGEPIPPERFTELGDGVYHLDQPGDAPDFWFDVTPISGAAMAEAAARIADEARATAETELRQYRLIGPDGTRQSVTLSPKWRSRAPVAEAEARLWYADPPKVMIGVQMEPPDRALAGHFGLKEDEATLLTAVYPDLPAAKAGLERYDLIVAIDGERPAGRELLRAKLREAEPEDVLKLSVIHRGEEREVEVTLAPYSQEALNKTPAGVVVLDPLERATGLWAEGRATAPYVLPEIAMTPLAEGRFRGIYGGAGDAQKMTERIDKLEQQLDRLETLLSRMMDQMGGEERPSQPPAPPPAEAAPEAPAPPRP